MKLKDTLQLLKKNAPALTQLGVKSLAVFGSTARQEATSMSDVDILVSFELPPTFDQYIETKFFLEDLLGCKVDLVTEDGLKPMVRAEVEKEMVFTAAAQALLADYQTDPELTAFQALDGDDLHFLL